MLMRGAWRAFGKPDQAACPWPMQAEAWSELHPVCALIAMIVVGAAPVVVSDPRAGGSDEKDASIFSGARVERMKKPCSWIYAERNRCRIFSPSRHRSPM